MSSSPQSSFGMDTLIEDEYLALTKKAKELAKEIDWVKTQKKREFIPQLMKLRDHSSVDVRRRSITALGEIGDKEIIPSLKEWQEGESDRTSWVALEGVIDKLHRKIEGSEESNQTVLTVSEALKVVKQLIGTKVYTIEGELSEVRPVRNLYFFGLKDKVDVRINCMLVSYNIGNIGFALNEGLQVRVRGSFKMSKDSRIYFDVKHIALTGEGELLRNLKLLDQKLQLEGLYDPSRKRKPVTLPQRVLLLASPNSAAIRDFTKVLGERRRGVDIYFLPIKTQGAGSEYDLLQALKQTHSIVHEYDIQTIIITRGGGSQDDLQLFNSENVVRAVHGLPVPSIVAIGHECDTTLAEKVADVRASTPSNAAELVSLSTVEAYSITQHALQKLTEQFKDRKNEYYTATYLLTQKIHRATSLKIREARETTYQSEKFFQSLVYRIRNEVSQTYNGIEYGLKLLIQYTHNSLPRIDTTSMRYLDTITNQRERVQSSHTRITQSLTEVFTKQKLMFESLSHFLHLSDPKENLEKGYAIIKQEKSVIDRIKHIDRTKPLTIQMFDAEISAKVDIEAKK
jgi:exodeoxyribonuclease VII large subunit